MVTKVGILIEVPQDWERAQIVRQLLAALALQILRFRLSEHQVATRSWRGACTIFSEIPIR